MKKIIKSLVVLSMIVGLTACGGNNDKSKSKETENNKTTEKTNDEKKKLEVTESNYDFDGEYVNYEIKLENPNTEYTIRFPTYVATAYDENGGVISTEEQVLHILGPQETHYWTGSLDCKGLTPNKVEFKTKSTDYYYSKTDKSLNEYLKIDNVTEINDDNETTYTGIVKNEYKEDISGVVIILIQRKDGKMVEGNINFVHDLSSNDSVPFEISGDNREIEYDSYEIYAYNWS